MDIAILGFDDLGKGLYELLRTKKNQIYRNYDLNIKYIYIENNHDSISLPDVITTNYNDIINDNSVSIVIDTGNNINSFEYLKTAIYSRKNVITTNEDVIANHYVELEAIAIDMGVKILFSATLGGIPIINTLLNQASYNEINKIEAILDSNINSIISLVSKENMSCKEAYDMLNNKNNIDLFGTTQAKKLAILAMIAFNTTLNEKEIHKYPIASLEDDVILVSNLLGYKLKYMASATLNQFSINASVEPILVKSDDIFSNVDYDYLMIKYYNSDNKVEAFYGTNDIKSVINSVISDIGLVLSDYNQKFMPRNSYICNGNRHVKSRYLIKPKILNDFFKNNTEKNLDKIIITSPILGEELLAHLNEIQFYARIID